MAPLSLARVIAVRNRAGAGVQAAQTGAKLAGALADLAQHLAPLQAACVVALALLEAAQHVRRNRDGCVRLAQRAAAVLLDLRAHARGWWPPALKRNVAKLESTLVVIYEFMKAETAANWRSRLLRRAQIADALDAYNVLLDDAARAFQISALIDIHYSLHKAAVGKKMPAGQEGSYIVVLNTHDDAFRETADVDPERTLGDHNTAHINEPNGTLREVNPEKTQITSSIENGRKRSDDIDEDNDTPPVDEISFATLEQLRAFDNKGFARYSQGVIQRLGRTAAADGSWWAGTTEVEVDGEALLLKTYDGPYRHRDWLRDAKALQTLYHPNLPQLVGLSDAAAPRPFLLLTGVQSRTPEALVADALRRASLAACATLILRLYRDVCAAALYTQREHELSDEQLQDFVENASYRLDAEHSVVVGLPPPREGTWVTWRSYGLTDTLLGVALKMLPNKGHPMDMYHVEDDNMPLAQQRKLSHLAVFARGLLPAKDAPPALSPAVHALLDAGGAVQLARLRTAGASAHAWRANQAIPPHKFAPGDVGHVPPGGALGADFVRLGNVLEEGLLRTEVARDAWAAKWDFAQPGMRQEDVQGFPMGPAVMGWPMPVNDGQKLDVQVSHTARVATSDAWVCLLAHGAALGKRFGVPPHELVLITSAGTNQDFALRNGFGAGMGHMALNPHAQPGFAHPRHGFGHPQPGFGRPGFGAFAQPKLPSLFYLFTAPDHDFRPYWAAQPMLLAPGAEPPPLGYGVVGDIRWRHGHVEYIMGSPEDFE